MTRLGLGILLAAWASCVTADSCAGRCGAALDNTMPCQCNVHCERFGDCCADYVSLCLSTCSGRCGAAADINFPCQCSADCETFADCCPDYNSLCAADPLSAAMQDIWNGDSNRMSSADISINPTGNNLFTNVNEAKLAQGTYALFVSLLDNYERNIGQAEIVVETSLQEINAFLNAVTNTEVMNIARNFLISQGKIGSSPTDFRTELEELWFNLYSRSSSSSILDSSGFEHVMVGELRNGAVSGFHSWIQFYLQEKANNLDFTSMVRTAEPSMKGAAFNWFGGTKSMGSFFLGTSPEFDMAVYTVCALMHPNARCNFNLQGNSVSIQTWDIGHKAGNQIGSAYPAI